MSDRAAAYLAFLRSKVPQAEVAGFAPLSPCHPSLFPHQRDICALTWPKVEQPQAMQAA